MAPSQAEAVAGDNYYQVLDIPRSASYDDIARSHRDLVRTLHPDRRRPGGQNREVMDRKFHQVMSAWRCLSDPTRRLLYDLRNFGESFSSPTGLGAAASTETVAGVPQGPQAMKMLADMQKKQAETDVANMQTSLEKVLRREKAKGGILIKIALYGDLRLREDKLAEGLAGKRTIERNDLRGPLIDVTLPMQCLVEQHTIVVQGGVSSSKADLPGFYNPSPLNKALEPELYVLYEFRCQLHEVIVGDREMVSLPRRQHMVPHSRVPRGPFSSANVTLIQSDHGVPSNHGNRGSATSRFISPSLVLERAVEEYRFISLRSRSSDEATPRECALIASCTIFAAAILLAWAKWDQHDLGSK
jgi:hypothetical protein